VLSSAARNRSTIRAGELVLALIVTANAVTALVQQPMMEPAIACMTSSPTSSGSSTRMHIVPRAALRYADNQRASHARRAS
jgi:hypothetical protein